MIETIYKHEGSENKKPDINIRLPKNIRQIGQSGKDMDCQIYIEEDVLSYIKQEPHKETQIRYGVLLGDIKQGNGYTYIFISGLVEVDEVIEDSIIFSDEVWTSIYDNIRRYYKEGIIVGWYASFGQDMAKDMLGIRKVHLDHFAGNNKVFLNINREDDEEAFYIYERNGLEKQPCYHVYFEKAIEFEDYVFGSGRGDNVMSKKEPAQKESGKYGIALNNSVGTSSANDVSKDGSILEKITKDGEKLAKGGLGKVASFATIIALAGVLGVMGSNGDLDVLGGKVKGFVSGIINPDNNNNDSNNYGNIIEVDGVPTKELSTKADGSSEEQQATLEDDSNGNITSGQEGEANAQNTTTTKNINSNMDIQSDVSEDASQQTGEKTTSTDEQETTSINTSEEETTKKTQATISDINTTYATYTVKDGETLYSIAMQFYGTPNMIEEIMELNEMADENYVMEGQKILLP